MLFQTHSFALRAILIFCCLSLGLGCQEKTTPPKSSPTSTSKIALVDQDEAQGFEHAMVLSDSEKEIQQKMDSLRQQLGRALRKQQLNFYKQPFHDVKKIIDTSSLYSIIQLMPKGGLLHTHSGGMTDAQWIIDHASSFPNCYVYTDTTTTKFVYGELAIFPKDSVPEGFTALKQKLENQPDFENELYSLLTLKGNESSAEDIWVAFEKRFLRIRSLSRYRPFFKAYYRKALLDLLSDRVTHVEIRFILDSLYDDTTTYPITTAVEDLKALETEIQQTYPKFSLRLIYTSFKFLDVPTVTSELVKAFELKKKYPDFITGFDLVAEEDRGNTVAFYAESWKKLDSLETAYGFDLPLFLHAGESNSIKNRNLYDAITLHSKRIGHGLNLVYFPSLIDQMKTQDIALEVNPISNQILRYVSDLRNHPARVLLKEGVQATISSDDAGVFAYEGLSYDFFMAYMAWELDLKALKKLVYNSIEYSTLEGEAKTKALQYLDQDWERFITKANTTLTQNKAKQS